LLNFKTSILGLRQDFKPAGLNRENVGLNTVSATDALFFPGVKSNAVRMPDLFK